ncbi:UNVERIFIED_CONTAM: hypothetical protein FKN15_045623 [Acipenser sinensis]
MDMSMESTSQKTSSRSAVSKDMELQAKREQFYNDVTDISVQKERRMDFRYKQICPRQRDVSASQGFYERPLQKPQMLGTSLISS